MYYSIKSGGWQRIAEPTGQEEGLLGIFPYEKMLACGKKWGISAEILEEARRFSYARYDSFENFDCVSLEMLDFDTVVNRRNTDSLKWNVAENELPMWRSFRWQRIEIMR